MAKLRLDCTDRGIQHDHERNLPRCTLLPVHWFVLGLFVLPIIGICGQPKHTSLSLAGQWRFALDPADAGIAQSWFNRALGDQIKLPGILQAQGYGNEISTNTPWVLTLYDTNWFLRDDYKAYTKPGNVKVPFICQPQRHYLGPAWYQRDIEIPADWHGRRTVVFFERVNWESRLWLNDKLIGTNNSLCTPHEFDLGILPPGKYRLTVRVDNRMLLPYRPDAHSVSDSLGQSWNGIVGRIELRSTPPVWLEKIQVYPHVQTKSATVRGKIGNATAKPGSGELIATVIPKHESRKPKTARNPKAEIRKTIAWDETGGSFELKLPLGEDALLWDEFSPSVYQLDLTLITHHGSQDTDRASRFSRQTTLGLREFRAVGQELVINGRLTHLRGTHHGGDFPLTGYPPCDIKYWRKLFATCKSWGLNHVRFHSFCPPEAAFEAADELGIYLQIEPGMWNTFNPGTPMEKMLYAETERIIKYYGNHPSFVLFSPSNEPKGRWHDVLPKWAVFFRARDPRRLYTTGTGFTDPDAPGPLDSVDFSATQRFGQRRVRGEPGWFGRDYRNALHGVTVPVIVHENGQWCAYPDFSVIKKFTGYLRPGNYEIFRDSARASGVLDWNKQFAWASGRFQLACYKEEIEAISRTPGLAGFQLLDLHDYIGQGTALVGVLDPFWEEKGYVTATEWRRFCSETVPLARLTKRVFTAAEKLEAELEVAHYGLAPLTNATVSWQVADARGKTLAHGAFPTRTIAIGRNTSLGKIELDLAKLPAPDAYKLIVLIRTAGDQRAESGAAPHAVASARRPQQFRSSPSPAQPMAVNDWSFWVYPIHVDVAAPPDVLVTRSWEEAETNLAAGGKVLFVPRMTDLNWFCPPLADVPVFWNRLMNPQWSRMLGLWCDTNHPALAKFPTPAHYDWQWAELVRNTRAINIGPLPRQLKPIVAAIDDWNRNWRLAPIFEAKVGRGKLLVCSFDIVNDLETRPVARQLRSSLLEYVTSRKFDPPVHVQPDQIRSLLFDTLIMRKLGVTARAPGTNPDAVIDGDPNTFWITTEPDPELIITFPKPVQMNGVVLMNRQNDRNHAGDIRTYKIEISDNGETWHQISRGELSSTWHPQSVKFSQPVTARHLKFTRLSGFGKDKSTALGELAVMYAGPKLPETACDKLEYQRVRSATPDIDEAHPHATTQPNLPPRP